MNPEVFEHNLRLLIGRAWIRVKPDPDFAERLGKACEQRMVANLQGAGQLPQTRHKPALYWPWVTGVLAAAALLVAIARPLWQTPAHSPDTRQSILVAGDIALRTPPGDGPWRAAANGTRLNAGQATRAIVPANASLHVKWETLGAEASVHPNSTASFAKNSGLSLEAGSAELRTQGLALPVSTPRTKLTFAEGIAQLHLTHTASDELLMLTLVSGKIQLQDGGFIEPRVRPYRLLNGRLEEPEDQDTPRTVVPGPKVLPTNEGPEPSDRPQTVQLALSIQDSDGAPIQTARLWTRLQVNLPKVSDALHQDVKAPTGTYQVELDPGGYTVVVEAPGYAPFLARDMILELGQAQSLDVTLERGRPISGYVVAADTGAPLQGALVVIEDCLPQEVLHAQGLDFQPYPYASALSDGSGYWVIRNAPIGLHTLRASARNHAPARMENVSVQALDMSPGLQELPHLDLLSGATLEGLVQRLDGNPWPETPVIASRIQFDASDVPMTYSSTLTDPEGRFRMEALPEGNYIVLLPEESRNGKNPRFQYARMTEGGLVSVHFPGLDGGKSGVRLKGQLRLASGEPAAQAQLTLTSRSTNTWQSTTADSDGRFVLLGVPPGEYEVAVGLGAGYESLTVLKPIQVTPEPEQFFEVRAGSSGIEGHALGATGGFVYLQRLHEGQWQAAGTAQVDGLGHFTLAGLNSGTLRGALFGKNPNQGYAPIEALQLEKNRLFQLKVQLSPAGSLAIRVTNSEGNPSSGIKIYLIDQSGKPLFFSNDARTDSAGECAVPIVPAGSWTIQASHKESSVKAERFFAPGDNQELHLILD